MLSRLYTLPYSCTLGNGEAMARQNARSDRVCLELFCCFFLSEKSKTTICKQVHLQQLSCIQHLTRITLVNYLVDTVIIPFHHCLGYFKSGDDQTRLNILSQIQLGTLLTLRRILGGEILRITKAKMIVL